jgi:hypothetical protein
MEGNGGHTGAAVEPRRVASIRIARESVDRARARSAAHKLDSQHGSVQISQRIPWELAGSQVSQQAAHLSLCAHGGEQERGLRANAHLCTSTGARPTSGLAPR